MANMKIKYIPKNDEVGCILHNEATGEFQKCYVTIDEDGTCMPERYVNFAESIENFEVRNSDVWVCSYPRTGTTWTQEMVWLIANNLDYEGAQTDLKQRFPYFEICTIFDFAEMDKRTGEKSPELNSHSIEFVRGLKSPRFIKTHLPFSLLPQEIRNGSKTPKIICVLRNPKDVCVSFYHLYTLLLGCRSNLENFSKLFLADKALYGSFWKHVLGYWEQRNLSNVLIITYEDMKKDQPSIIKKVGSFLNKTMTDEQVEQLAKHLSFESMKNNKAVNGEKVTELRRKHNVVPKEGAFMRSGRIGSYKEELSPETIEKFDAWIKQNISGTKFGEKYKFEL